MAYLMAAESRNANPRRAAVRKMVQRKLRGMGAPSRDPLDGGCITGCPQNFTQDPNDCSCSPIGGCPTSCPAGYTQNPNDCTCTKTPGTGCSVPCAAGYTQNPSDCSCTKVGGPSTFPCEYAYPACGDGSSSHAVFVNPVPPEVCGHFICTPNVPAPCPTGYQRDVNGNCVILPGTGAGTIYDPNTNTLITIAQLAAYYAISPQKYAVLYQQYIGPLPIDPGTQCPTGQSLAPNGQCAFSCPANFEFNAANQCVPLPGSTGLPTTTGANIWDVNSGRYITITQLAALYATAPAIYASLYNQYFGGVGTSYPGGVNVNTFTYYDPITGQTLNFNQLAQMAAQYPQYYGTVYQQALASVGANAGNIPGTNITATQGYGYGTAANQSSPSAFSWFGEKTLIGGIPNGVSLGLGLVGIVVVSKVLQKSLK